MNKRILTATLCTLILLAGCSTNSKSDTIVDDNNVNKTDMAALKSSKHTSGGFDAVELGDDLTTIEEKLGGKLSSAGEQNGYQVFSFKDEEVGSTYLMYFTDGKLEEVTVAY